MEQRGAINMIICKINMPINNNEGVKLTSLHARLKIELVTVFSGCTITEGQGVWLSDGVVYDEPVKIYETAINGDKVAMLVNIAKKYALEAGQLAVYYSIDGKAFIEDIIPPFTVQSRPSPNNPNVT
jgi:hypothetical protein